VSAVWIVREVAEIADLLDQAQRRSLSLAMKLRTHAEDLKTRSVGGLPRMLSSAGIAEAAAGEVAKLHVGIEPLLVQAAVGREADGGHGHDPGA
jgi:hypothetical protein